MKKLWLVTTTTYKQRIRSGMFLILTFALPLLMIVAGAIPIVLGLGSDLSQVGLVDETGQLAPATQLTADGSTIAVRTYDNGPAAQAAFQRGEIGGYLIVPAGYFGGEPARFYAEKEPGIATSDALTTLMRQAMLPNQPDWLLARLNDPAQVTYVARQSGEQVAEGPGLVVRVALPAALGLVFALAVWTGASQMGAAIVREKDQRSMEMIVTSLAPWQLVAGKVLGMALLSLTQLAIWVMGAGIAVGLALSGSLDLQGLSIPWSALMWALLLGVPGYFLYAALASGLGVIAGDRQQARQLSGVLGFVGLAPLWLMGVLVQTPDGSLAVALTLFPLTSPILSMFRMALTEVPTWQLAAGLALTLLSLAATIWIVARVFRAAMLMYGQSLRPRQIVRALREA